MDVGGWLRSLGLGRYEALFRASEIDADILPELTDGDLEKLGVPLGHRKRLLKAISGLAAAATAAAPSASTACTIICARRTKPAPRFRECATSLNWPTSSGLRVRTRMVIGRVPRQDDAIPSTICGRESLLNLPDAPVSGDRVAVAAPQFAMAVRSSNTRISALAPGLRAPIVPFTAEKPGRHDARFRRAACRKQQFRYHRWQIPDRIALAACDAGSVFYRRDRAQAAGFRSVRGGCLIARGDGA
jgi:hypothetical protein